MVNDYTILNRKTFIKLKKEALRHKPLKDDVFDSYSYFLSNPRRLRSADDLITTISIAYSWMPTMLDIFDNNEKSLASLARDIKAFKSIDTSRKLIQKETEIKELLQRLSRATNNSIVGASKVLHLFFPANIPIFDSRTVKAWNKLFPTKMKIPILNAKNQVNCYYNYWLAILYWKEKLSKSNVREIEKLLFDYGGYLKSKRNSEIKRQK